MTGGSRSLVPVPQELTTLEGMAEHLALMTGTSELSTKAVAWFQGLAQPMQLDLIRSVRTKPEYMRRLLGLVPDSTELLSFLGLPLVRRICDESAGFLSAVAPERTLEIVRQTQSQEAKREWLALICEAYQAEPEKFESFVSGLSPQELASFLVGLFRYRDIKLLDGARCGPDEIEDILDETFPFMRELFIQRPELYDVTIEALQSHLFLRYEQRSRQRTLEELQQRWPGFWQDVRREEHDIHESEFDEEDEDEEEEPKDD